MRYIPVTRLEEGMILARPVYGPGIKILLSEGMALNASHIARIVKTGYTGAYVDDEMSSGIEAKDVIPDLTRIETVRAAKELLLQIEKIPAQKAGIRISGDVRQRIVMPVVDALLIGRRRVFEIIDLRPDEDYPYYHAVNVMLLSLVLGLETGLTAIQLSELGMAALLHDVGNIFIPPFILQKPGPLLPEEYETVKQHTEMGFQFLRDNFDLPIDACLGALQHHENYDGSGYPGQLQGDRISFYGRIIAVTDVYDALVSRRPFRMPMTPPEAMEFMQYHSGTMFDPMLIKDLQRVEPLYPTGSTVELSSGVRCIVTRNNPGASSRPCLRLLDGKSKTPMLIDLQNDARFSSLKISRLLDM